MIYVAFILHYFNFSLAPHSLKTLILTIIFKGLFNFYNLTSICANCSKAFISNNYKVNRTVKDIIICR